MSITKDALIKAVKDYKSTYSSSRFRGSENLKPKQLATAVQYICPQIKVSDVIAFWDETMTRNGKKGFVLTQDTLYLTKGYPIQGSGGKRWVRLSDMTETMKKTEKDVYKYVGVVHENGETEWMHAGIYQEDFFDFFSCAIKYSNQGKPQRGPEKTAPAIPTTPTVSDRADRKTKENTKKEFQCVICGEKLILHPGMDSVTCDFCDTEYRASDFKQLKGLKCDLCGAEMVPFHSSGDTFDCICPSCGNSYSAEELNEAFGGNGKSAASQSGTEGGASAPKQDFGSRVADLRKGLESFDKGHELFQMCRYQEAIPFYELAADAGMNKAMYNVAVCYNNIYAKQLKVEQDPQLLYKAWEWLKKAEKHGYKTEGTQFYALRNEIMRGLYEEKAFDFAHEDLWAIYAGRSFSDKREYACYLSEKASTEAEFRLAEKWARECTEKQYSEGLALMPIYKLFRRRCKVAQTKEELEKALELGMELTGLYTAWEQLHYWEIPDLLVRLGRLSEAEAWAVQNKLPKSYLRNVRDKIKNEQKQKRKK